MEVTFYNRSKDIYPSMLWSTAPHEEVAKLIATADMLDTGGNVTEQKPNRLGSALGGLFGTKKHLKLRDSHDVESRLAEVSMPVPLLLLEMAEEHYFASDNGKLRQNKINRMMMSELSGRPSYVFSTTMLSWLDAYPDEFDDLLKMIGDRVIELEKLGVHKQPEEIETIKELVDGTFERIDARQKIDHEAKVYLENLEQRDELEQAQRRADEQMIAAQIETESEYLAQSNRQLTEQAIENDDAYERNALIEGIKALKKVDGLD